MKELMSNFKDLDKDVAAQAVNIISETQELLGNGSLLVMGMIRVHYTSYGYLLWHLSDIDNFSFSYFHFS